MQIDQLIDHGRGALQHHGGQGRVAALRLELTEVFGRHLPTLAGQLEQAVLVDVPAQAFGQVHQLKCLQPLDVFQHVPRVGFQRCLAQPGQPVMLLPALSFNSSSSLARCESVSGSTRAR